jgi:hypothetical protein
MHLKRLPLTLVRPFEATPSRLLEPHNPLRSHALSKNEWKAVIETHSIAMCPQPSCSACFPPKTFCRPDWGNVVLRLIQVQGDTTRRSVAYKADSSYLAFTV